MIDPRSFSLILVDSWRSASRRLAIKRQVSIGTKLYPVVNLTRPDTRATVGTYLLRNASLRDEPTVNCVEGERKSCAARLIAHAGDLINASCWLAEGFQDRLDHAPWQTEY